jgi:hypothetical protein
MGHRHSVRCGLRALVSKVSDLAVKLRWGKIVGSGSSSSDNEVCPFPACFEGLEDRKLMSSVGLSAGLFYLVGDIGSNNTITASVSGSSLNYNLNGQTGSYPLNQIQEVRVIGGVANDSINIDPSLTMGVNINTNDGNDTIYGGSGSDTIFAGTGTDYVDGRGGSNSLQGGGNSSTVINANWVGHSTTTSGSGTTNTNPNPTGTPTITGYALINSDTGAVIQNIPDGSTIDLSSLPTRHLNIEPLIGGSVASVFYQYDGIYQYNLSNSSPFMLSTSNSWTPTVGKHQMFGLPATQLSGGGTRGSQAWLNFTVIDSGTATPTTTTTTSTGTPNISGYNLINADTGAVIQNITEGSTIDLGKLPTRHLNIAPIISGTVSSVFYQYDGIYQYNLTNTSPFMLSTSNTWAPAVGSHQMFGLAATQTGGGGTRSAQAWLNFNVTDSGGNSTTTTQTSATSGTTNTNPTGTTFSNPTVISSDPNAPHVAITPIASTIMAGNAFQADALATGLSAGDAIHTRYAWDFGDPNGAHNQMVGWNAAHIYDTPGTYTVTMTVTDSLGRTSVGTRQVNVTPDTRRKIYVSQAGNDANNGSSDSQAVRSIARANQLDLGGNAEVLFRRGDTWELTTDVVISGANTLVGAYGSGAQPTLKMASTSLADLVHLGVETVNATVQDINFDSDFSADLNKTGGNVAVTPAGIDCAVRNCTFTNVCDAVNSASQPNGMFIEDNVVPTETSLRGYFAWVQGSDFVIVGNKVPNSTREHIIRIGGADRVEIASNDFTNENRQSVDPQDIEKATITAQKGSYVYITGNTIHTGGIGMGPLGQGDGVNDPGARMNYVVVEANHVVGTAISPTPGVAHVMIRNNIIERASNEGIWVRPFDFTQNASGGYAYQGRTISDISIINNTAISSGTFFRLVFVDATEFQNQIAGQITMDNNVYYDPQEQTGNEESALVYVADNNLNAFREISHNVWSTPTTLGYADGGYFYVYSYWSNSLGYLTPGEWASNSQVTGEQYDNSPLQSNYAPSVNGKAATGAGAVGGVFTDFYGKWRPTNTPWSAGAVQL